MGLGGMSEEWVCMKSMWYRERKGDEKNMKTQREEWVQGGMSEEWVCMKHEGSMVGMSMKGERMRA